MSVAKLLDELDELGIRLWADGDRLRYDAPSGALTPSLGSKLKARKGEILELLKAGQASTLSSPIPRIERTGDLATSFAQKRLWFLDQLADDATHYNIVRAFHMTGALDVPALKRALGDITERHESLRTTFVSARGAPMQRIAPTLDVDLPVEDLGTLPRGERLAKARDIASEEYLLPFDLRQGPLFRAKLLRLDEGDHVLVLSIHHIVADGWSMGVLFRDLEAFYRMRATGQGPSPEPLRVQYADFAVWQHHRLSGETLERHLTHWKNKLTELPVLRLPTDRPHPAVPTFRGAREVVRIPNELSQRLKELGRQDGATSFMTLLAVFSILLQRYTGDDDIVVGSPIANRNHASTEGLIGFFVNMLIMRVDLSDNPSYRELLGRVKEWAVDAYEHQDLPFERLVEALDPDRDSSHNPLFQISFAVQNAPREGHELGGLRLDVLELETRTTHFDLEVHIWEEETGLTVWFVYNSDLFDAATIERMTSHYRRLLEAVVQRPDAPVRELELLSDEERRRVVVEWNETARPYPRERSIKDLFEEQVKRSPDAVAIVSDSETVTYSELNRRANRIAHRLVNAGVNPETMVALCMERSVETIAALLGIVKAGGAYVPMDPSHPQSRLSFVLEDTETPILVTTRSLREQLPEFSGRVEYVDEMGSVEPSLSETNPAVTVGPHHLAYVIYTSGSTGTPKGACIEHRSVVRLVKSPNYLEIDSSDVFLGFAPISFDASTLEVWGPLLNGAKLVVHPPGVPSLEELGQTIRDKNVSILWLTATLFHQMVDAQLDSLRGVRQLLAGGEALSVPHVRRMLDALKDGHRLINGYGPTENTTFTTCHVMTSSTRVGSSVPIGWPISNTQVYIVDVEMNPVPIGVVGELYAGGDGLAREYLRRPELTAEKFVDNPFGKGRLYRTGDQARYLTDGSIEFQGRVDHQVKLRGYRIELGEIESVLSGLETVRDCVATVQHGPGGEDRLIAYVVPNDTHADEKDELRSVAQVSQWQTTYEQLYGEERLKALSDPTFDISGWNSSYSGEPFSEAAMREWVRSTVERIQAFGPRRVLEIGCGTGLILFRVAPGCERYTAADFSEAAITSLRETASASDELGHVEFWHRSAENFEGVGHGDYDTVVLNSVIQYWPSADYLVQVLEAAVDATAAGGRIFIGDVRCLPLLEALHASVQLQRSGPTISAGELGQQARYRLARESELVVAPAFFEELKSHLPRIGEVQILLKRGRDDNEMTQFRYDVVLHVERARAELPETSWLDWKSEALSLPKLEDALTSNTADVLAVGGIPNARLTPHVRLVNWMRDASPSQRAFDFLEASSGTDDGVHPESIWELGPALSYDVELTYSRDDQPEHMDALFRRSAELVRVTTPVAPRKETSQSEPWSRYTNDPLSARRITDLSTQLREYAKTQMPDFMVPSTFVVLDALPLSPNGKVDRRALPNPDPDRAGVESAYIRPQTKIESRIVSIWQEVLGVSTVGVRDNFFDLGGHSLMATQVVSRMLDAFNVTLSLADFFERPTVAQLAEHVENARWLLEGGRNDSHAHSDSHVAGEL